MTIHGFLQHVAESLEMAFPAIVSSEVVPGRFSVNELKTAATATPALRLALSDIDPVSESDGGEVDYSLGLSLAVITADATALPREEAAHNLVGEILRMIAKGATWGVGRSLLPEKLSAQNLYDEALAQLGVQLWDIRWRQTIRLGDTDWQPEGVMPIELYAGQSPKIGPGHESDYILIEGNA